MDKQQLLQYFQNNYLSRQDVLFKLPLNISIDSFWQDLVNQRKARATVLPLFTASSQPYWFVTTDKMVKASERLCEEAMRHDSFFDPYRIPLSQALTSALSQEAYFTSYVEGAEYPIQAAVDFLRRGTEPENAYEQNILNNYQAGSYLLSALSIPFDETFVKELAAILGEGLVDTVSAGQGAALSAGQGAMSVSGQGAALSAGQGMPLPAGYSGQNVQNTSGFYRTTDMPVIPAMEGEPYTVPPAYMLPDRMGQFYNYLADVRVHPLIKAAVAQAFILTTRPFPEANERLGRLISNAVLLRFGYDYFLDISISAYIARESFRYFKAMREIIRSDNEGDLTYFVEYYLELLVRALDGTRKEEAERLQSQLEAERQMALQPLEQPSDPSTPPLRDPSTPPLQHPQGNGADGGPGTYPSGRTETYPDGGTRNNSSSSAGDSWSYADSGPIDSPLDDSGPVQSGTADVEQTAGEQTVKEQMDTGVTAAANKLLGLPKELRARISEMIKSGISPFTSVQWGELFGISPRLAGYECREFYLEGLTDRTKRNTTHYYSFRFTSKDMTSANLKIKKAAYADPHTREAWNRAVSLLEQSGIESCEIAARFVREQLRNGVSRFYAGQMACMGLSDSKIQAAIKILAERGIIKKPEYKYGKYEIVFPGMGATSAAGAISAAGSITAVTSQSTMCSPATAPKVRDTEDTTSSDLQARLDSLIDSESDADRRVGAILSQLQQAGKLVFRAKDWEMYSSFSKATVGKDLLNAVSLGLVEKVSTSGYAIKISPHAGACWENMTFNTCKILDGIIRSFGENRFTTHDAAQAMGISDSTMSYHMKYLKTRSLIRKSDSGYNRYELAVPIGEAIQHLREYGFAQMTLVG